MSLASSGSSRTELRSRVYSAQLGSAMETQLYQLRQNAEKEAEALQNQIN